MVSLFWSWVTDDVAGFFTFVLVVVAVVQLFLFVWQLRLIRESLNDAKEAADASTRQARAAEDSLTKLERPYIFAFNVSGIAIEPPGGPDEGELLRVSYSVANYGKIPAVIKEARVGMNVFSEPFNPPVLGPHHSLSISPILAAGEIRHDLEEFLQWENFTATKDDPHAPDFGDDELFFSVVITYRGPFSDGHETRACWRYDQYSGRFIGPYGGAEHSGER